MKVTKGSPWLILCVCTSPPHKKKRNNFYRIIVLFSKETWCLENYLFSEGISNNTMKNTEREPQEESTDSFSERGLASPPRSHHPWQVMLPLLCPLCSMLCSQAGVHGKAQLQGWKLLLSFLPSFLLLLPPPTPWQGARLRTLGCAGTGQPGIEQSPLLCLLNAHLVCSLHGPSSFSYLRITFIFVDPVLLLTRIGVDSGVPFA